MHAPQVYVRPGQDRRVGCDRSAGGIGGASVRRRDQFLKKLLSSGRIVVQQRGDGQTVECAGLVRVFRQDLLERSRGGSRILSRDFVIAFGEQLAQFVRRDGRTSFRFFCGGRGGGGGFRGEREIPQELALGLYVRSEENTSELLSS